MPNLIPQYPIVRVYWKDITAGDKWFNKEKILEWGKAEYGRECTTIGYLIESNADYVIVAGTFADFDGEENFNDYSLVMNSVIYKTEILKEVPTI